MTQHVAKIECALSRREVMIGRPVCLLRSRSVPRLMLRRSQPNGGGKALSPWVGIAPDGTNHHHVGRRPRWAGS